MSPEFLAVLTVEYINEHGVPCTRGESDVYMPGVGADKDLHTAEDIKAALYTSLKRRYNFQHAETVHWSLTENQLLPKPVEIGLGRRGRRENEEQVS